MTSDLKILETLIDPSDLEQRKVMTLDEKLENSGVAVICTASGLVEAAYRCLNPTDAVLYQS